jgi:hypothetical protein
MNFHSLQRPANPLPWPLALGHFLPWFTIRGDDFPLHPDDAATLDWLPKIENMRHWKDDRAEYRRTHLDLPEIGIYDSRDPGVIEWQIQTAQQYGISGFILNWYGKYSAENVITLHWLRTLEQWNRKHPDQPFLYFLSYDMQAQWPSEGKRPVSMEEDFIYIRDHLIRGTYLCRDGRPLFAVFPYGDQREDFRRTLDKVFGPRGADLIWSGTPAGNLVDGCYAWVRPDDEAIDPHGSCSWVDPDNCGEKQLRRMYEQANAEASPCAYIMHGAWPGFNSQFVAWAWNPNPRDPGIRPRVMCRQTTEGSALERTWNVYLDYLKRHHKGDHHSSIPAPLVQIVTWNDYAESTTVEPTKDYGRGPLEQCLKYIKKAQTLSGGS